jgi:CBS domain-containing protein
MQPIERTIVPDVISEQRLVTLSPRDTAKTAVELMAKRRIGAVPIVDKGRLVGIFTERDVVLRTSPPAAIRRRPCSPRS